jgi:hypothetical protein
MVFYRRRSFTISSSTLAGICGIALLVTVFRCYEAVSSDAWPTTTAEVSESYKTRTTGRRSRTYVHLRFEYTVEGNTYHTGRVSFFDWGPFSPKTDSSYALETYPKGRSVTMLYNPQDPSDSVVENDIPPRVIVFVFVLTVVGIISGYIALFPEVWTRFQTASYGKPEDYARAGDW